MTSRLVLQYIPPISYTPLKDRSRCFIKAIARVAPDLGHVLRPCKMGRTPHLQACHLATPCRMAHDGPYSYSGRSKTDFWFGPKRVPDQPTYGCASAPATDRELNWRLHGLEISPSSKVPTRPHDSATSSRAIHMTWFPLIYTTLSSA